MLTFPGFHPGITFAAHVFVRVGFCGLRALKAISPKPQGYPRKPQGPTQKGTVLSPPFHTSAAVIDMCRISKPSLEPGTMHTQPAPWL